MWFSAFLQDLRESARRIRRNVRVTALAVATLAIGVGAASAVFTIFHAVLLAPLPFHDAGRLVLLSMRDAQGRGGVGQADQQDWIRRTSAFESIARTAYDEYHWTGQSLPAFAGPEVIRGRAVSASYFAIMQGPMALGRGFLAEESSPAKSRVAVLSYGLWQRRFSGNPGVLGQALTLDGRAHTIVGVAGPGFRTFDSYDIQIWTPIAESPNSVRGNRAYYAVGRLKPGATMEAAKRQLDELSIQLAKEYPRENGGWTTQIIPLAEQFRRGARPALHALIAAVLCLLLIAGANVASLLLARASVQGREMAIRSALGATPARLYSMAFSEMLLLAGMGAAAGALVSLWTLAGLATLVPDASQLAWAFRPGLGFVTGTLGAAALVGLLAGAGPAMESVRAASTELAASPGSLQSTPRRSRLLHGVIIAEVALAALLSIAGGLLLKGFAGLVRTPLGYGTDKILAMRIRVAGERYRTLESRAAFWTDLLQRVRALPGVMRAEAVSTLPMGHAYQGNFFWVPGRPEPPSHDRPTANVRAVTPGYFATLGIPLLQGRTFDESDSPGANSVVIVNDMLAAKFWPGKSALGEQIAWQGRSWTVAGVVQRVRHSGPSDQHEYEIYAPFQQWMPNMMFLAVKSAGAPESLTAAIRAELRNLDSDIAPFEIRTMRESLSDELAGPRLPAVLIGAFAGVAASLATLGLFGVITYWVTRRTREIGVRTALGGSPAKIRAMVLRQGARLAATGLAIGIASAFVFTRFLSALLWGVSPYDHQVYLGVAAAAASVSMLACLLPAQRAARTDPSSALRHD